MIKFSASSPDGPLYGFGLSRENINKLTAGMPIRINLQDLGGPAVHIAIMFGETESAIYNELKSAGLIHPDIQYRDAETGEVIVVRVKESGEGTIRLDERGRSEASG